MRRTLLGRERLGVITKLNLPSEIIEFLSFRQCSRLDGHGIDEKEAATTSMLSSLTRLMREVSPKDLPSHVQLHQTSFDVIDRNEYDLNMARNSNAHRITV